jgi:hypothetical protein
VPDDGDAPKLNPPSLNDLYRELDRLRGELEKSERARERLKRENELAAARRAGKRQAAPFSKGRRPHGLGRPGAGPGGGTVSMDRTGRRPRSTKSSMSRSLLGVRIAVAA